MNLSVNSYIQHFENLLEKNHLLMKKLNSVKNRAMLRRKGATVCPVLRCKTRWSGDYAMVSWFLEIREFIDSSDLEVNDLLPTPRKIILIRKMFDSMKNFQSVTLKLQEEKFNLGIVRQHFESLICDYSRIQIYFALDAKIVNNRTFESGNYNQYFDLTANEKRAFKS